MTSILQMQSWHPNSPRPDLPQLAPMAVADCAGVSVPGIADAKFREILGITLGVQDSVTDDERNAAGRLASGST